MRRAILLRFRQCSMVRGTSHVNRPLLDPSTSASSTATAAAVSTVTGNNPESPSIAQAEYTSFLARWPPRSTFLSPPRLVDAEQKLYSTRIRFFQSHDKEIELDTVYQDTLPAGSPVATVVSLHGSPGSHKDFKYITPRLVERGIRVVGVNFPGYGFSQDSYDLTADNAERNAFIQAIMDGLELQHNVVMMGHSRGSENALMVAALNPKTVSGAVLMNAPGLLIHKGIRPFSFIEFVTNMYERFPILRPLINTFLYYLYNYVVGLRLNEGRVAAICVAAMKTTALWRQRPFLEALQNDDRMQRLVIAFAGKDFLIETQISRELVAELRDREHFECKTSDDSEEDAAIAGMRKALVGKGNRSVSAEFATDGHFLQKFRAKFIAEAVVAVAEAAAAAATATAKGNKL